MPNSNSISHTREYEMQQAVSKLCDELAKGEESGRKEGWLTREDVERELKKHIDEKAVSKETAAVIEDIENDRNMSKEFSSVEELMQDLNSDDQIKQKIRHKTHLRRIKLYLFSSGLTSALVVHVFLNVAHTLLGVLLELVEHILKSGLGGLWRLFLGLLGSVVKTSAAAVTAVVGLFEILAGRIIHRLFYGKGYFAVIVHSKHLYLDGLTLGKVVLYLAYECVSDLADMYHSRSAGLQLNKCAEFSDTRNFSLVNFTYI